MGLTEIDYKLIARKIDGELSSADETVFESKIMEKDFLEEWEFQKKTIENFNRIQLRRDLKDSLVRNRKPRTKFLEKRTFFYSIAASVGIIVISSLIYFTYFLPSSPTQLFERYYHPYPLALTRGNSEKLTYTSLQYNSGNYDAALEGFLDLQANPAISTIDNLTLDIVIGNCYLNMKQHEKASEYFNKVSGSRDPFFSEQGKWYQAMNLLFQGKISDCRALLATLVAENSSYKQRAQSLIESLPHQ
jgi:hypothetical protein